MIKMKIDDMSFRHLDYAFAKVSGLLFCSDSVMVRQENGNISCYHLSKFNPSQNLELLNELFKQLKFSIKVETEGKNFFIMLGDKIIKNEYKTIVLLKGYLLSKTEGFVEIPTKMK